MSSKDRKHFLNLAAKVHDPSRYEKAERALSAAAGVYQDASKAKALELWNTVVVVSRKKSFEHHDHYIISLLVLC